MIMVQLLLISTCRMLQRPVSLNHFCGHVASRCCFVVLARDSHDLGLYEFHLSLLLHPIIIDIAEHPLVFAPWVDLLPPVAVVPPWASPGRIRSLRSNFIGQCKSIRTANDIVPQFVNGGWTGGHALRTEAVIERHGTLARGGTLGTGRDGARP